MIKAKDKSDPFRLMGFGHRVYKNFDPRAKIIKIAAHEVLKDLGINDPILEIAKSLEKEALDDEYFTSRKLYPNVDFYSGIACDRLRWAFVQPKAKLDNVIKHDKMVS